MLGAPNGEELFMHFGANGYHDMDNQERRSSHDYSVVDLESLSRWSSREHSGEDEATRGGVVDADDLLSQGSEEPEEIPEKRPESGIELRGEERKEVGGGVIDAEDVLSQGDEEVDQVPEEGLGSGSEPGGAAEEKRQEVGGGVVDAEDLLSQGEEEVGEEVAEEDSGSRNEPEFEGGVVEAEDLLSHEEEAVGEVLEEEGADAEASSFGRGYEETERASKGLSKSEIAGEARSEDGADRTRETREDEQGYEEDFEPDGDGPAGKERPRRTAEAGVLASPAMLPVVKEDAMAAKALLQRVHALRGRVSRLAQRASRSHMREGGRHVYTTLSDVRSFVALYQPYPGALERVKRWRRSQPQSATS